MKEYKTKGQQRDFYKSKEWRGKNGMRNQILTRANYECEWCKAEGKVTTSDKALLEIDHIKELEDYPDLALEESNLRVLCKHHHNVRHKRFLGGDKEEEWKDEKW